MEEISLKGEKYVKASVIAEKLGYTADYVGQLCRSKQVDATLVGRSWYVSEKSISQHKKSRYRSTVTKSKESVRKLATERSYARDSRHTASLKPSYKEDDSDLFPVIVKSKTSEYSKSEGEREAELPRSVENKPQNEESFGLSEKYEKPPVREVRRNLPPVRIISGRVNDISPMPTKEKQSADRMRNHYHGVKEGTFKPKNGILAAFTWLTVVLLTLAISLSVIGLEKRVVLVDSDSEVVLYNFNLHPFLDYLKSFFTD